MKTMRRQQPPSLHHRPVKINLFYQNNKCEGELPTIQELIQKTRSYRRFYQDQAISEATLRKLVDLARLSASAGNRQPLKYVLSWTPQRNNLIFPCLAWAGYLKQWPGPAEGERPAAYIIVLGDTRISQSFGCDQGIAVQSIMLGAVDQGWGGCILAAINRPQLTQALHIPSYLEILLVLALGKPKESVVVEALPSGGSIEYWRDEEQVHHVPKRDLAELIIDLPEES